RTAYVATYNEVQKLAQAHETKAAADLLHKQLKALHQKYAAAAEAAVAYNKARSDEAGQSIGEAVSSARRGVLTGLLCALAIAAFICLRVTRSITRPLAGAVGLVEQVS